MLNLNCKFIFDMVGYYKFFTIQEFRTTKEIFQCFNVIWISFRVWAVYII